MDENGGRAGKLWVLWAVVGVAASLGWAALRLGARGLDAMAAGLGPWEWGALAALTVLFVYGEGERALGRKWVPWMLGRARRLPGEGLLLRVLGPLYAMALVGRDAGQVARSWAGLAAILLAVWVVSRFPPPWRGITDFAVAAALAWGVAAILRNRVRRGGPAPDRDAPTGSPPPRP